VVLGVIGLFSMFSYAGSHTVAGSAWAWVLGTLVVGALGLGALRGLSMRVWDGGGWVLRQGTAVTMALWLVSLLVHFAGDAGGDHAGAAGLVGASFLLYLGLTLAVQYYVVYRRALPLWAKLGPDAGRGPRVQFTQNPGVFFATFRSPSGGPSGPAWPAGWEPATGPSDDPNVIDAEVVEDDEEHGPPELHAPR
jgi:hypothetical protein